MCATGFFPPLFELCEGTKERKEEIVSVLRPPDASFFKYALNMSGVLRDSNSLLTPAGQPYSCSELLVKYSTTNPRDMYTALCKKCGCKPISAVASRFPDKVGTWNQLDVIDVSKTYVGPKGIIPLIEICKLLPNVETLIFRDNYLNNEAIWYLSKMVMFHPSIKTLDLSRNAISWTSAMCLVELVTKNIQVGSVILSDTAIPQGIVEAIQAQVAKNASLGGRKQRRGPNPCNHPTTIRQRALKRYFNEISGKKDTVPRSRLSDGLKEMWKISGREREITQRTPLFYENFNKRAPNDEVDWETFLILVMLEDVQCNEAFVGKLRHIFQQFDIDCGGFVEVRELKAMMTLLSPTLTPPSAEELKLKLHFYDLDEQMTLTWDEFLLLMYDHGPVVGAKAEMTRTPLPPVPYSLHN